MTQKEIRLLRADEIECRVGMVNEKGLSLLLYKDARADMKILDETFGSTGWQRIHELIGGNLYCRVQIWDEEKQQWWTIVNKKDTIFKYIFWERLDSLPIPESCFHFVWCQIA